MGYRLRMSGEIQDWLENLRTADPPRARLVAEALAALAAGGASLGSPLVRPADPADPGPADGGLDRRARLDQAYQDELEQLTALRRRAADAATLARQFSTQIGDLSSLRLRLAEQHQEASAAGDASRADAVQQAIADVDRQLATLREAAAPGERSGRAGPGTGRVTSGRCAPRSCGPGRKHSRRGTRPRKASAWWPAPPRPWMPTWPGEPDPERDAGQPGPAAASSQAKLRAVTAEIEGELRRAGQPANEAGLPALLELRPEAPGTEAGSAVETSILFAVEPPGTALLIAVLDGGEATETSRRGGQRGPGCAAAGPSRPGRGASRAPLPGRRLGAGCLRLSLTRPRAAGPATRHRSAPRPAARWPSARRAAGPSSSQSRPRPRTGRDGRFPGR